MTFPKKWTLQKVREKEPVSSLLRIRRRGNRATALVPSVAAGVPPGSSARAFFFLRSSRFRAQLYAGLVSGFDLPPSALAKCEKNSRPCFWCRYFHVDLSRVLLRRRRMVRRPRIQKLDVRSY